MRGIDISNWQKNIVPSKMPIDFCIVKATEGKTFVDKNCDTFVQDCVKHHIPWGFYHFARENNPEAEAEHFYNSCKNYFGHGIPVLDYEVQNSNNVKWCEKFLNKLYDLSGVWALIYISASRCPEYKGSWIPEKCGLWVAGYPKNYTKWINDKMPYIISPWKNAVIWQFTSSLQLEGYRGGLDGDLAYITREEWNKYASKNNGNNSNTNSVDITNTPIYTLANEVIEGKYGVGQERREKLGKRYDEVQSVINTLYKLANEVIKGKWGNGAKRKQKLENAGYPYAIIQKIVNQKLGGK